MKIKFVICSVFLSVLLGICAFSAPIDMIAEVETAQETTSVITSESSDVYAQTLNISISTAEQFNAFANSVNSGTEGYQSAVCTLSNNIDFNGDELIPIGTSSKPFMGTLDGNGYTIFNADIKPKNYSGVVGYLKGGCIKNIGVIGCTLDVTTSSNLYAGLLCGYAEGVKGTDTLISNCSASGSVIGKSTGAISNIGGLVGKVFVEKGTCEITDCKADCNVTADAATSCYAGGFVGNAIAMSSVIYTITNCNASGNVNCGKVASHTFAGGFSGYLNQDERGWSGWFSDSEAELFANTYNLESCFASGNVVSESIYDNNAGGFSAYIGTHVKLNKCYRASDSTVDATLVSTGGNPILKKNFTDVDFLTKTLLYDLVNTWYIDDNNMICLRVLCRTNGAPVSFDAAQIRTNNPVGMRYLASANNQMRSYSAEYGFIIALDDNVGSNELTFDSGIKYVSGAAFVRDAEEPIDKIYDMDNTGIMYTGVLVNIPDYAYKTIFVARPYVKYVADGETVILYGEPVKRSPYQVALAISQSDEYENMTDSQKKVIDDIISK